MSCPECENIEEIKNLDSPFVIRKCEFCGREMKILDPGDHGIGIRVNKGDRFVIPAEWLKISANPLKGTGHFTKAGLEWFAKLIFLGEFPRKKEQIDQTLKINDEICVNILNESDLLSGLNVEKLEDSEKIFNILAENKESAEWFAYTFGMFNQITHEAIKEGDAQKAAWAMAGAERFRSMLVFKQELEEVIWMGHSAKRLIDILEIWRSNKTNSDEEFWQIQFNQHAYVISQVFSVPVVFIEEKAYVGGKVINRQDARFIDFLFSGDMSNESILIEIKTPSTHILGSKYRNVYKPSAELTGALIQIADYKTILTEQLAMISRDLDRKLTVTIQV